MKMIDLHLIYVKEIVRYDSNFNLNARLFPT